MPSIPHRLASTLEKGIASDYVTFTPTTDAFLHLATVARERFTVMFPISIALARNAHNLHP